MSKEKIRDLVVCIISLAVLIFVAATNVFAADDLSALTGDTSNPAGTFEQIGEENKNVNTNTPTNTNTNTNTGSGANNVTSAANNTVNKTNKNVTSYPDTGVDYSVVGIILVCGISAVYAYKRIRDYKNF